MKIVCAGFHRSGSTWLYNVVRIMCEQVYGEKHVCAGFYNQWDRNTQADCYVIKTHRFHSDLEDANFVFTTVRDLRDVAASAVRMKMTTEEGAYAWIAHLVQTEYEPWTERTNLELVYEQFNKNKPASIARIAKKLNFDLDAKAIHEKVESLEIPKEKANPKEQLHPNHISNANNRKLLSGTTIRRIELSNATKDFMQKYLYV